MFMLAQAASTNIQMYGAMGFGALIGWYVYYINRYRKTDVALSDLVTLVGVIGGGAVLALFPAKSDLFGAYGLGLFFGFFGYFATLLIMVAVSKRFGVEFFLDGRRKNAESDETYGPADPNEPGGSGKPMIRDPR